jgi:hypothetical protein
MIREPDHAVSGPLQELIKHWERKFAGGLEQSDRTKEGRHFCRPFWLKV